MRCANCHHQCCERSTVIVTRTGPPGPRGPQGSRGPQGTVGPRGATGVQGPRGAVGFQGNQGPQGISIVGAQGPQGITGPQGSQGPQGFSIVGPRGPQGIVGLQGSQGPQGRVGFQGPQGISGPQGAIGPQGPQGPAPTTVAFLATSTTIEGLTGEGIFFVLPFDIVVYDRVNGLPSSNFNPGIGIFTAPVSGAYDFQASATVTLATGSDTPATVVARIMSNGPGGPFFETVVPAVPSSPGGAITFVLSGQLYVPSGNSVTVQIMVPADVVSTVLVSEALTGPAPTPVYGQLRSFSGQLVMAF